MLLSFFESNSSILPQLLVNSLITGSIYALASSGLALTFGVSKILNFAHGHFMMLGAYLFYLFASILNLSFFTTLSFSLLGLGIIATFSYQTCIKPFHKISPLLPFVTTLSLSAIIEAFVSLIFGVNVLSYNTTTLSESWSFFLIYITPLQLLTIIISLSILFLLGLFVHFSRQGRSLRAVSTNPQASETLGISSQSKLLISFVVGAIFAGIAGILLGYETNLQPTMGSAFTIKAFAAMILGGMGNIWGTVIGAYLLGLVENLAIGLDFGSFSIPSGYRDAFGFIVILLILLFRPQGLLGSSGRKV